MSTAELARLALVLKRIEGTDKLRLQRERAAEKAAAEAAAKAAPGAGQAPVRKGLSPEAVAAIREVVEGRPRPTERAVTSAPVDPWSPSASHLIPLNPGESRPENDRDVSRLDSKTHLPLSPSPGGGGGTPPEMPVTPSTALHGGEESHAATACSPSPPPGAERAGERWGAI